MVNSRTKGHAFERMIVNKINSWLDSQDLHFERVKRNLDQVTFKGQADIYFRNFAIECKRYKTAPQGIYKQEWWKQVCYAANDEYIPVLVYKFDRRPIQVVLPLFLFDEESKPDWNQIYLTSLEDLHDRSEIILRRAKQFGLKQ